MSDSVRDDPEVPPEIVADLPTRSIDITSFVTALMKQTEQRESPVPES